MQNLLWLADGLMRFCLIEIKKAYLIIGTMKSNFKDILNLGT